MLTIVTDIFHFTKNFASDDLYNNAYLISDNFNIEGDDYELDHIVSCKL